MSIRKRHLGLFITSGLVLCSQMILAGPPTGHHANTKSHPAATKADSESADKTNDKDKDKFVKIEVRHMGLTKEELARYQKTHDRLVPDNPKTSDQDDGKGTKSKSLNEVKKSPSYIPNARKTPKGL